MEETHLEYIMLNDITTNDFDPTNILVNDGVADNLEKVYIQLTGDTSG